MGKQLLIFLTLFASALQLDADAAAQSVTSRGFVEDDTVASDGEDAAAETVTLQQGSATRARQAEPVSGFQTSPRRRADAPTANDLLSEEDKAELRRLRGTQQPDEGPPPPPEEEEEGYRTRLREAESELDTLRRGIQSGRLSGGILFPGRDPSGFKPFAPLAGREAIPPVSVTGFFQQDTAFFSQDPASVASFGALQNGADFRRARLAALGSVTENVNYIIEFDFAQSGHPTFKDNYVEVTNIPLVSNVRVGYFKAPFSLSELSSARQLEFLERALPVNAFAPFRRIGIMAYDHDEDLRHTWAYSLARGGISDPYGGDIGNQGGWAGVGRVTWLPYYDDPSEGRYYLHLGFAYQYAEPGNQQFKFRSNPEIVLNSQQTGGVAGTSGSSLPGPINGVPFFANTGTLKVENYNMWGTELAGSIGSLHLQSEYMATLVRQVANPVAFFQGAYAQAGYFLTGEHRRYSRAAGTLGAVRPFEDFFTTRGGSGRGAWELAGRISWLDLDSHNVQGGRLTDLTAGLNWYLNANVKVQFNYIHAFQTNAAHGLNNTDIYATRVQAAF